ncbi:PREDICTED: rho GTPase-activating protein SYDE2-like [Nipponia nippon]|uniref:rho GTPase-activating protein SYDE2-like n=1 Tax=Nipponia nippon TaxID=128390 RepID=UPI0005115C31|nr:PREDICTED: rho GTPase-activating protein SYDE2-like [Nipponia nippon]
MALLLGGLLGRALTRGSNLIENVYIASRSRKEPKFPQASEVPEHRLQVNNITVSKKRSWLQQSTHRTPPPPLEEENTCKETHGAVIPIPKSPILLPETAVPRAPSTLPVGRERPARSCAPVGALPSAESPAVPRSAAVDFSEDNDADDEGEIWYNPIPEDDEPDLPRVCPSSVNSPVAEGSLAVRYKPRPGGDSGTATVPHEGPPRSMESTGDNRMAQPSEASQADVVHPGEHMQQHRQRFACKVPSVPAVEDNPAFKCPSTGTAVEDALRTAAMMKSRQWSAPSPLIVQAASGGYSASPPLFS